MAHCSTLMKKANWTLSSIKPKFGASHRSAASKHVMGKSHSMSRKTKEDHLLSRKIREDEDVRSSFSGPFKFVNELYNFGL